MLYPPSKGVNGQGERAYRVAGEEDVGRHVAEGMPEEGGKVHIAKLCIMLHMKCREKLKPC